MTISMYQASIPVFKRFLTNQKSILQMAEAHAVAKKIDPAVFLTARLYPDMFALTRQVQIAADVAKNAVGRISGKEPPKFDDNETSFAELYARIDKTIANLDSYQASDIDGQEDRDITFMAGGNEMKFKGQPYLLTWAMPNFYFHVMTTYAILRHNGVAVGKMDYLGRS